MPFGDWQGFASVSLYPQDLVATVPFFHVALHAIHVVICLPDIPGQVQLHPLVDWYFYWDQGAICARPSIGLIVTWLILPRTGEYRQRLLSGTQGLEGQVVDGLGSSTGCRYKGYLRIIPPEPFQLFGTRLLALPSFPSPAQFAQLAFGRQNKGFRGPTQNPSRRKRPGSRN